MIRHILAGVWSLVWSPVYTVVWECLSLAVNDKVEENTECDIFDKTSVTWGTATLVGIGLMNLYAQEEQMYRCRWQTRIF